MECYRKGTQLYLKEFIRNVDIFPMLHETISMNSHTKDKLLTTSNICIADSSLLKFYCGKTILINEDLEDDVVVLGKYYNIVNKES